MQSPNFIKLRKLKREYELIYKHYIGQAGRMFKRRIEEHLTLTLILHSENKSFPSTLLESLEIIRYNSRLNHQTEMNISPLGTALSISLVALIFYYFIPPKTIKQNLMPKYVRIF